MSDVMVHIMLHGLMALVPVNGDNGQLNHMAALLVDAQQPRDLQCFVPHKAKLIIATSNNECFAAGCSVNTESCTCDIDEFNEITLAPDVQPTADRLDTKPESALPFNVTKATNFAYIANLANWGKKIKPELINFASAPSPNPLIARMIFPFKSANACSLATRRDEGGDNVHSLNFRKIGDLEGENEISQALAQAFVAEYTLPDDGTGRDPQLTITLRKPGADPRPMNLKIGQDAAGHKFYSITLENRRAYELLPDDPCDDGVARDFALFYDLAVADDPPMPDEERLIPHIKYTRWKSSTELLAKACQDMKELMSRPICPIGAFYSSSGGAQ